jgi:hypothetical protein
MPQQKPLKEVYFLFLHTLTSSVTYFEYSAANELALCIRQHPSAYVYFECSAANELALCMLHTSAYVSIRQHTRTWNKSPRTSLRSATHHTQTHRDSRTHAHTHTHTHTHKAYAKKNAHKNTSKRKREKTPTTAATASEPPRMTAYISPRYFLHFPPIFFP